MLVFGAAHLRQILSAYAAYYNEVRTHLALGQLENAEYCLREALAIACEVADRLAISQLQPDLAAVLARRGSYDGVASA